MLPAVQNFFSDSGSALILIATARLVANGLWRKYPAFTSFLGLQILRSAFLMHASPTADSYTSIWAVTSVAVWIAQLFACLECCALISSCFGGKADPSEQFFKAPFSIAATFALAFGLTHLRDNPYAGGWFGTVVGVGRALTLSCALLMIVQAFLIRRSSAFLTRNLIIHRCTFMLYSAVIAAALTLTTDFSARIAEWTNLYMGCATALISGVWAASFRRVWEGPSIGHADSIVSQAAGSS